MQQSIDMAPILAAIAPELAAGKRRINIWNFNHLNSNAEDIALSLELREAMKQHGRPAYAIELVGETASGFADYMKDLDSRRPRERRAMLANSDPIYSLLHKLWRNHDVVIFPKSGFEANLTYKEQAGYNRFLEWLSPRRSVNSNFCELNDTYFESLSSGARDIFEAAVKKIHTAAYGENGNELGNRDGLVAANIEAEIARKGLNEQPHVLLTVYGALHFAKRLDLDEHLGGISMAVVGHPGEVRTFYLNTSCDKPPNYDGPYKELPEYVFYSEQNRVVRLNNDAAKMEFIGCSQEEYREFLKHSEPLVVQNVPNATQIVFAGHEQTGTEVSPTRIAGAVISTSPNHPAIAV